MFMSTEAVLCVVGCVVVAAWAVRLHIRKLEGRWIDRLLAADKRTKSERLRVSKLIRELDDLEEGSTGWSETDAEAQEFGILCRQAKDDELQTAHAACVRFVEGGTRPVSRVEEVRLLKAAGAFKVNGSKKSKPARSRGTRGSSSPNGQQGRETATDDAPLWDGNRRG